MNSYSRLLTHVASSRAVNGIAKQLLPDWVTVFMLHRLAVPEAGVEGLSTALLEQCLDYLCEEGYRFISLEDAARRALDGTLGREKWVAFSLDDGFTEQVMLAGDIFAKFNCTSTCFLLTGFIDGDLWQWEHQLIYLLKHTTAKSLTARIADRDFTFNLDMPKAHRPIIAAIRRLAASKSYQIVDTTTAELQVELPTQPPIDEQPATWDEVRAMEARGMQFAPHTVTHRIVSGLSDEEQSEEIERSFARIRQECSNPANVFCYPSGQLDQYDTRMFAKLRDFGV